jgi:hypothetical protein
VSPSAGKSKALYQNEAAARNVGGNVANSGATSPSGLDDLATAVAGSSGLSGSGLQRSNLKTAGPAQAATRAAPPAQTPPVDYATPAAQPRKFPILPIAMIGGVVFLGLIAVIVVLFMRGTPTSSTTPAGGGGATGSASFCGEPIVGQSVVYLLDNANSIAGDFDPLKAATYTSIASLGSDHKFAIVLWHNSGDDFTFPRDGLATANSAQIDALRGKFEDIQATGASHLRAALNNAIARNPSALVIVTAKPRLDDDDEAALNSAKETAGGKIRFYAFSLGSQPNQFLKMTADSTSAKYRQLTSQDLRAATP